MDSEQQTRKTGLNDVRAEAPYNKANYAVRVKVLFCRICDGIQNLRCLGEGYAHQNLVLGDSYPTKGACETKGKNGTRDLPVHFFEIVLPQSAKKDDVFLVTMLNQRAENITLRLI